jgi:hypothetical protein
MKGSTKPGSPSSQAAEQLRQKRSTARTGQAMIDAFQSSPHREINIEPARMPLPVRDAPVLM